MLAAKSPKAVIGRPRPRVAPLRPARSKVGDFKQTAAHIGINLMPWQEVAGTYLTALGKGDRWLWPEVAVIVARQNGKTELLVPLIVSRLLAGRRIMHTAQNRELPREVFARVADIFVEEYRSELRSKPRYANGQETIRLRNGGHYRIVAPSRGGARGPANDDVIVDEVRELDNYDFIAAAKPTLSQSTNPQMVYLSNAGEDDSIVLNDIKSRADADESLAYIEWSADGKRDVSDRAGWLEANPAVGELEGHDMMAYLEKEFRAYSLTGRLSIFETEHLCRWVTSTRQRLVDEFAWMACQSDSLDTGKRVYLAVSMDPSGKRASVAAAWKQQDGTVALRLLYDVLGDPIDTDALGKDLQKTAHELGAKEVAFDPMTDRELVKFVTKSKAISGRDFANASARFDLIVKGRKLRWQDAEGVTNDLTWTARKEHEESGSFIAVRANDERPITAALAAIRAVWLASGPPVAGLKVY